MGKVVFAAPSIARYHLHEALSRRLLRRGHEVRVLASDPVTHRFYLAQGMRSRLLPRRVATTELRGMPIEEVAMRDCQLRGASRPTNGQAARARRGVAHFVPGLLRFFGTEVPDLVLFHEQRTGLHRLVQFLATEFGCETLHTGAGLLPGTMQWDGEGLDGDSSKIRRTAEDYARQPRDEMILMAALAAVLGGATAPPLDRTVVRTPGFADRVAGVLDALRRKQFGPAWHGLTAWRRAIDAGTAAGHVRGELPTGPFVAVLLQDEDSAAMRVDAVDPADHAELVVAARRAAWGIDSALPLVVILPPGGLSASALEAIGKRAGPFVVCSEDDTMVALTTALAVITVNHPHGLVPVLAGTPLLHTGTALYGGAGVTCPTTLDRLQEDLADAVQRPNPAHRSSYLTRTLVYDHVWCSPTEPDQNGLRGLVQTIENRIARHTQPQRPIDYRAGPVWPLASTSED